MDDTEIRSADPIPASPEGSETRPEETADGSEAKRSGRFWGEWGKPLLIILVVMCSIRSVLADWNDVPTGSMKPTIVEGDRIFVNKAAYGLRVPFTLYRLVAWDEPKWGDIVVLLSPDDGKRLVKRVIGLPGDRIELRRGRLYVNGEQAEYQPLDPEVVEAVPPEERISHLFADEELSGASHPVMIGERIDVMSFYGPRVVPPGHYFVMGDNRSHSRDSRAFGFVEESRIIGQATAVVFSWNKDEGTLLRWDRFFHKLR